MPRVVAECVDGSAELVPNMTDLTGVVCPSQSFWFDRCERGRYGHRGRREGLDMYAPNCETHDTECAKEVVKVHERHVLSHDVCVS